jgi:hypothetical protein
VSYASEVLADNPEWYYRFEEPSGAFIDSSPNAVDCTETGGTPATRSVTGPVTGSVGITANATTTLSLDYVATADSAQTVEGWFRTTTTGHVVIMQNRGGAAHIGLCLQLAMGATGFGAGAGQITAFFNKTSYWLGIHTTGTFNDGNWHHVAATWVGSGTITTGQISIYVDGVLVGTTSDSNTGSANSAPVTGAQVMTLFNAGGAAVGGTHAPIDADEMAFYASALSGARIAAHYAAAVTPDLTADFSAAPRTGTAAPGETVAVAFTDESSGGTGTIDRWLWDFGDGTTSTLQDPTHDYPQGSYTVTLTVTTDDDEIDTLTRTSYIVIEGDYVAPEPGAAILEIYASDPGSPKWDVALWDVDAWSEAAWQDVTPQGIDVDIRWGSPSPEAGILTETEAATWLVNTYDPDRLMDPGNAESPYAGDIKSGLPIRLRHLETVIRQGVCETIAYYHAQDRGAIRATDNLSKLARTMVPSDSVLSNTLRARARDAIAAAGLATTVEPDPPSGDPALAPRLTGDRSVWRHIHDAGEQVLHIPYVDRLGTLRFREWSAPYDRGRSVDSTQLIDLGVIVQTRGLYSVVQVRNLVGEGDDIIERSLTPTPSYGKVTYLRNDATPDSDAWADAVLADRGLQTLQYIPGDIYPLTADAVGYFATLEAIERFGVSHPQADPAVGITGIIVGGSIYVRGKRDSAAQWRFSLELAQTATAPLYDDTDPGEFLLSDAGDEYLYPDT